MSYNIPHNIYQQQQQQPFSYAQVPSLSLNETNTNYIGHKTSRNNVILSNTTDNNINDLMSNANESSIVGNNANTIINSNKNSLLNLYLQDNVISNTHSLISKPIIKHHSAPIKLLHTNSGVFETHCFLKTQSESHNNSDEHNEGNGSDSDRKYKCGHLTCDLTYKTKKQKVAHHAKMDLECQKDTINHLKLISELKNMILHLLMKKNKIKNDKTFQKLNQKFKQTVNDISLSEYAEMICGKVIYSSTPQHAKYLNNIGHNNNS
jgi:ribosomal protein S6